MKWIIDNEEEMSEIAHKIIPLLKVGDVVALEGTLGVGKTTFVRAFIQSLLKKKVEVPSPTFTLLQTYTTPKFTLYHFDCYRLKSPDEAYELGIEEAFTDGISMIEWPEKIAPLLPSNHKTIRFQILKNGKRCIQTEGL